MTDTEKKNENLRKSCTWLYAANALSAVLQLADDLNVGLAGVLLMVIIGIVDNSKKKAAQDTPYASHLRWMNRTIWIGSLYFIVCLIIGFALVVALTDTSFILAGDPDAVMNGFQSYVARYQTRIAVITAVTMAPPVIWWIRRCWIGYSLLKEDKPVEKVTSWL